ncbi:MAG: DUF6588 family protein [bacterium]
MQSPGAACRTVLFCLLVLTLAGSVPRLANAEVVRLQHQLEDVGEEYAAAYLASFVTALGVDQNSRLFSTAHIPTTQLTVSFGLQFMGSHLAESDQTFRSVKQVVLDERFGFDQVADAGVFGETGTLVMEGPSFFGDEDVTGSYTTYYNGVPLGTEEGINGVWRSRWLPLFMPEVTCGGIAGLRATLRWLSPITLPEEAGTIRLLGFGVQYNLSQHIKEPPAGIELMAGFFHQNFGLDDVVSSRATSLFLAASKTTGFSTFYGGLAFERSRTDVDYLYLFDGGSERVTFEAKGQQGRRLTLGGTLGGPVRFNLEASFGKLSNLASGITFHL